MDLPEQVGGGRLDDWRMVDSDVVPKMHERYIDILPVTTRYVSNMPTYIYSIYIYIYMINTYTHMILHSLYLGYTHL